TEHIITAALSQSPTSSFGERLFPPPSGLSYSTWFCVEHFSTSPHTHPVRLLTVVRRATASEQHYVCLAIVLSAKDRSLIVSTKEELLQSYGKLLRVHTFHHRLHHTHRRIMSI
ncbi:WD repeat and FYVE domain-containing protein 3 isoform X1, partial [Tachysurus ichikawai]